MTSGIEQLAANHAERDHQGRFVETGGLEPEVSVEACCRLVGGVDKHGANTNLVGGTRDSQQRIEEQASTEPCAVVITMDRQSRDQDDRDRKMASKPSANRRSRAFVLDLCGNEGVIAGDVIVRSRRDESACRATALALAGIGAKPDVERLVA